jgi:APA family basic amino acid/polyamine antiporter
VVLSKAGVNMTEEEKKTKRELGIFFAIISGLGSTLGIEFFVLLDYATQLAGPAVVLSLVISGLINLMIMLNYAELSSSISKVGAEYTFTKAAFGGFVCFLSGWLRWLSSIFTTTLSAMGLALVVCTYLPQINPSTFAVAVIAIFTVISVRGGKIVDLVTVLSFIIVFLVLGVVSSIHGFSFENFQIFMPNGFYPGVLSGVMYTFSMYVGMRAIATKSPVIKEPGKVIPWAVLASTLISIAVYCGVAFIAVGVVPQNPEATDLLLVRMGNAILGSWGVLLVVVALALAAFMSLATSMSVQSSILSALSRDGYLPRIIFSQENSSVSRYVAQLVGSFLAMFFAATGLITFVGYASGFASLIVFALVNLSLIKLRKGQPDLDRPFKTPLYPYSPIFGVIVALALMIFVESSAVMLVLEFILVSLMIYHLKMMGYIRLRLAVGGINVGIGSLITLILVLQQTGILQLPLYPNDQLAFLLIGSLIAAIFFIAGVYCLTRSRKESAETIDKLWVE